jgi:hypothetical protein
VLYDWGATITLITHDAARRTGLQPIRQQTKSVSGLNGVKIASTCFYMVPMVDCDDDVQVIKALGVTRIAWMDEGTLPPEMEARFSVCVCPPLGEHATFRLDRLLIKISVFPLSLSSNSTSAQVQKTYS